MTFTWGDYQIITLPYRGHAQDLSRAEARANYNRLMELKADRIQMLSCLLSANGIQLSADDDGVQRLNDFFVQNVTEDPDRPTAILPEWISVTFDVALFLGDAMIAHHPSLHWELHVWGKRNFDYQRAVISGFRNVQVKNYAKGLIDRLLGYAHEIANQANGPEIVTIRGHQLEIERTPIRPDLFLVLIHSEDANV